MLRSIYKNSRACLLAMLILGGCSDDSAERARTAYDKYDFDLAWNLALDLRQKGNPVGLELLALMSVQGLGRDADIGLAYSLAREATELDFTYSWLEEVVTQHVRASIAAAQDAFDRGDYSRSLLLAMPGSDFGEDRAVSLVEDLVLGQYVPHNESELAWRTFWRECSGNTRFDTPEEAVQVFNRVCAGKRVIWDGYVIRSARDNIKIKMAPGRARVRHDLIVKLLDEPDYGFLRGRKKIRFSGIVEVRGDESKPDQLSNGHVIGLAPLTRAERAQLPNIAKQDVMSICQRLALEKLEKDHMPEWSQNLSPEIQALSEEARALFVRAGIISKEDVFQKMPDGGWKGRFEGQLTVHSRAAYKGTSSLFIAECAVAPPRKAKDSLESLAKVVIISVVEPEDSYSGSPR